MISQSRFLQVVAGTAEQKEFKIVDPLGGSKTVREIDITLAQNEGEPDSSATGGSWVVAVDYENAPGSDLFNKSFSDEASARKVYDDLCHQAAAVEGLIREEKMDEATQASAALQQTMTSNSSEGPVNPAQTGAPQ